MKKVWQKNEHGSIFWDTYLHNDCVETVYPHKGDIAGEFLCPKCGKPIDLSGNEWVCLEFTTPFKWDVTAHRDCAIEIKKDMGGA